MASRPTGLRLNLIGHGRRLLDLLGPETAGGKSTFVEVLARRYRCLACHAVCLVVPRGVWPRRRYLGSAIALALALWTVRSMPESAVREQISPMPMVGLAVTGWTTLRRWARAYGLGTGTLRQRAERYVQQLAARSPLSLQQYAIEPRIYSACLHPV